MNLFMPRRKLGCGPKRSTWLLPLGSSLCLWQLNANDIAFCPVDARSSQKRAFLAECACFKDKGVCISHFNFQGLVCTLSVKGSQNHVLCTKRLGVYTCVTLIGCSESSTVAFVTWAGHGARPRRQR